MGVGKTDMDVICFYWNGTDRPGWTNKELGAEYVSKLYRGVKRNLSTPHRFICFTNIDDLPVDPAIEKRDLPIPYKAGCLPKLYAYAPNNGLQGRVVMMDIDIVVTGDLDEMFSYNGYFMTRSTFKGAKLSGGDIAFFEAGTMNWIWNMDKEWTEGRERFIYREYLHDKMDFVQDLYPNQLFSYKNHIRKKGLPENARLVSCHGNPRPHEIKEKWIKEHWV